MRDFKTLSKAMQQKVYYDANKYTMAAQRGFYAFLDRVKQLERVNNDSEEIRALVTVTKPYFDASIKLERDINTAVRTNDVVAFKKLFHESKANNEWLRDAINPCLH